MSSTIQKVRVSIRYNMDGDCPFGMWEWTCPACGTVGRILQKRTIFPEGKVGVHCQQEVDLLKNFMDALAECPDIIDSDWSRVQNVAESRDKERGHPQ